MIAGLEVAIDSDSVSFADGPTALRRNIPHLLVSAWHNRSTAHLRPRAASMRPSAIPPFSVRLHAPLSPASQLLSCSIPAPPSELAAYPLSIPRLSNHDRLNRWPERFLQHFTTHASLSATWKGPRSECQMLSGLARGTYGRFGRPSAEIGSLLEVLYLDASKLPAREVVIQPSS